MFDIGPFHVYSWGLFFVLAFIAGIVVAVKAARRHGIPAENIYDMALWILVGSIVGARALYVALEWPSYAGEPWWRIIGFETGGLQGLSFHGGLLGGFLAGLWFAKRRHLSVPTLANVVSPALALGYAIAKVGCFLNGDDYGTLTNVPWAVRSWMVPGLRHPVQLYDGFLNFLLFILLWRLLPNKRFAHGRLFALYLALYSLIRFTTEFVRESPVLFFGWMKVAQFASLVVGLGAVAWILLSRYAERTRSGPDAARATRTSSANSRQRLARQKLK